MPSFFAIVMQTIRTSVRQKVFLAELLLVLAIVVTVPVACSGDGTAIGLVQLILSYTLGLLVTVCSAATLWIACLSMSREIEGYQMHLVSSTPMPRWLVFAGKWAGVFAVQCVICLIGATCAFGMLHWRIQHERFTPEQTAQLDTELLVARHAYMPKPPNITELVEENYRQKLANRELASNHDPVEVKDEIRRQFKARSTEVALGVTRAWEMTGIRPAPAGTRAVFLRYRHYAGEIAQNKQRELAGVWYIRAPDGKAVALPQKVMSGTFQEIPLAPKVIAENGTFQFAYLNALKENGAVVFQPEDGPVLLVPDGGFWGNYCRAIFLVLLQLAFLAALGCTVSAMFSSPVAVFMATAYIFIGILVQAAVAVPTQIDEKYLYKDKIEQTMHWVALGVKAGIVSISDFDASRDLTQGHKISAERMASSFALLIGLRTLPMVLLGIWIFTRRELGLVIRE